MPLLGGLDPPADGMPSAVTAAEQFARDRSSLDRWGEARSRQARGGRSRFRIEDAPSLFSIEVFFADDVQPVVLDQIDQLVWQNDAGVF